MTALWIVVGIAIWAVLALSFILVIRAGTRPFPMPDDLPPTEEK